MRTKDKRQRTKALLLLPVLALLALGCATSSAPSTPSGQGAEAGVESIQVGTEVGDRIPDFAINLADGGAVTLNELRQDSQPAFLFFFETW